MAEILEQIGKMSVNEQVRVLEYLCTMLVPHYTGETPGWHGDVLRETEARVAAGEDRFMSLEESKRLFGETVHGSDVVPGTSGTVRLVGFVACCDG